MKRIIATLFSADQGSAVRSLIRAIAVVLTAFGFKMSVDQMAAIILVLESILALGVKFVPEP